MVRWDGVSSRRLTFVSSDFGAQAGSSASTPGWRSESGRPLVGRLETDRVLEANLSTSAPAASDNKELEQHMLQSNWSAVYQLFYERFGVEHLGRIERGFAVKERALSSAEHVALSYEIKIPFKAK